MKEYIEREAARDLMEQTLADEWEIQYADDRLDEIPAADVVEVVRCQDCKWRPRNLGEGVFVEHLDFPMDTDGVAVCPYAADDPWYNKEPHPYGFCHLGVREVIDN